MTIVDARAWVEDLHFLDGFHLYPEGSAAFSQRLEREVLLPVVRAFASSRSGKD